jgi:hypothetical protein
MNSQKNLNTNFKVQLENKEQAQIKIMPQETKNLAIAPQKKENKFRKFLEEKTDFRGISMFFK